MGFTGDDDAETRRQGDVNLPSFNQLISWLKEGSFTYLPLVIHHQYVIFAIGPNIVPDHLVD